MNFECDTVTVLALWLALAIQELCFDPNAGLCA